MISKFEDEMKDLYHELITHELLTQELSIHDMLTYGESYDVSTTGIFILIMLKKQDSLLNCLSKISFDIVLKKIDKTSEDKAIITKVIKSAENIASFDHSDEITDEHLLYAILINPDCIAYKVLEEMKINMVEMINTVKEYLEIMEDDYLTNISELAIKKRLNPFIGKEEYIDKIKRILNKKQKNNCLLIGSAGVGKSALVEGLAMSFINEGKYETIYRLEIGSLLAGTRYRGDLEERLIDVIEKVKDKQSILFIDEIHSIMGISRNEDSINIASILKPVLSRSEIKCIGATTLDEYYEYIEKDKAFCRRFQNIFIPEATEEETLQILQKTKFKYEEYYNISIPNKITKKVIENCIYFPNKKFPDKAIDLLDELGAITKNKGLKSPNEKDIKKVVFENIGLKIYQNQRIEYSELLPYYKMFYLGFGSRKTIASIYYKGNNLDTLLTDIKTLFTVTNEAIIRLDLELFNEGTMTYLTREVLKMPILVIIIDNYQKAIFEAQRKIDKLIETGEVNDTNHHANGRIIRFTNVIFIFTSIGENSSIIGYKQKETTSIKSKFDLIIECKKKSKQRDLQLLLLNLKKNKYNITIDENKIDLKSDYEELMRYIPHILKEKKRKKLIITKENNYLTVK